MVVEFVKTPLNYALSKKISRMYVRFVIRKARVNQIGTCPVNCRITIDSVKANEFAVGISVDPEKWDSKRQKLKGASSTVLDINRRLDLIKSQIEEIYMAAKSRGGKISAFDVKDIYTGKREISCSLKKMGELFLKELRAKDRSKVTLKRYERCFGYLLTYIKRDMPVETVERRHVAGFWMWLKSQDYDDDYCNKLVQICIGLFRFGLREGYVDKSPFDGVTLEWKKELDITCLSGEEIELIKNQEWDDRLQKVADNFLFMCYTGLHISDYIDTVEENIYLFENRQWMKIKRIKTGVEAKFPLHSYVLWLINKYGSIGKMPRISAQKMNDYLKLIALTVGIRKNLTNKIARKTFTDMAINEYNMSFESVAKMLGHTSTRQIRHYGSVSEKRIMSEWKDIVA